jgi:hypothetical protein
LRFLDWLGSLAVAMKTLLQTLVSVLSATFGAFLRLTRRTWGEKIGNRGKHEGGVEVKTISLSGTNGGFRASLALGLCLGLLAGCSGQVADAPASQDSVDAASDARDVPVAPDAADAPVSSDSADVPVPSDTADVPVPVDVPAPVGVQVTPGEGGSLVSEDGRYKLVIPPGAVSEPVYVTVRKLAKAEITANLPPAVPADAVYELLPEGLQFAEPAAATFTLTLAEAGMTTPGVTPAIGCISRAADGTIEGLESSTAVDEVAGTFTVTGKVSHLSWHSSTELGFGFSCGDEPVHGLQCGEVFSMPWTLFGTRQGGTSFVSLKAYGDKLVGEDPPKGTHDKDKLAYGASWNGRVDCACVCGGTNAISRCWLSVETLLAGTDKPEHSWTNLFKLATCKSSTIHAPVGTASVGIDGADPDPASGSMTITAQKVDAPRDIVVQERDPGMALMASLLVGGDLHFVRATSRPAGGPTRGSPSVLLAGTYVTGQDAFVMDPAGSGVEIAEIDGVYAMAAATDGSGTWIAGQTPERDLVVAKLDTGLAVAKSVKIHIAGYTFEVHRMALLADGRPAVAATMRPQTVPTRAAVIVVAADLSGAKAVLLDTGSDGGTAMFVSAKAAGGLFLAGQLGPGADLDGYVVALDGTLAVLWATRIAMTAQTGTDSVSSAFERPDGTGVVVAVGSSTPSFGRHVLFELDAATGLPKWERRYKGTPLAAWPVPGGIRIIGQMPDGPILMGAAEDGSMDSCTVANNGSPITELTASALVLGAGTEVVAADVSTPTLTVTPMAPPASSTPTFPAEKDLCTQ